MYSRNPQSPGESLTCRHFPAIPVTYPACCRIFAMEGSSLNEGRDAVWFDMPPVRNPYRPVISRQRDGPQSGVA